MSLETFENNVGKEGSPMEDVKDVDICVKESEGQRKLHKEHAELVPYNEPEWSSSPPPNYKLEVLKNGKIISNIPITKSYVMFGRLQACDVALEHPSVSRYHAVLQYCSGDGSRLKGFYIYDLGSTHGTFLNKKQLTAKVYYKVEIDHSVKFGGSSRLHILVGPQEEEQQVNEGEPDKPEEEVCDWGMGEDADEEEDLSVNPFALSTANEELYLEDPKKTLRGWFEREGYDLEYDVEEKGFRTFVCRVQLPIDTPTGEYPVAEASVTGKKKEAVVACALEACRILDRHGVLRQARHENRRKKRKNWEDQDFYDSDEDTYLDRTGTIEKKREIRKKMVRKAEVETFQSLTSKLESVNAEISEIEHKLQGCSSNLNSLSDDEEDKEDTLDSYMSQIEGSGAIVDKVTKRQLRLKVAELYKEQNRLEKLLDIARPTPLPPVAKTFGIIGKRPTKKFQLPTVTTAYEISKNNTEEFEEEEDSDSENESSTAKTEPAAQDCSDLHKSKVSISVTCSESTKESKSTVAETHKPESTVAETHKPESTVAETHKPESTVAETHKPESTVAETHKPESTVAETHKPESTVAESHEPENTVAKTHEPESTIAENIPHTSEKNNSAKKSKEILPKTAAGVKNKSAKPTGKGDVYKSYDSDYSMWVPPDNQTGDGTTHLNAKYGY